MPQGHTYRICPADNYLKLREKNYRSDKRRDSRYERRRKLDLCGAYEEYLHEDFASDDQWLEWELYDFSCMKDILLLYLFGVDASEYDVDIELVTIRFSDIDSSSTGISSASQSTVAPSDDSLSN